VLIDHDTQDALELVTGLLNSPLDDLGELADFIAEHRVSGADTLRDDDLVAVREVRDRFATACAAESVATAAGLLNDLVAGAGTTPRLTDHDGHAWHVHYFAPGASLAQRLAADGGMALVFLAVAGERERLRRCAAPGCGRAFVDLSRNRSRRYCSSRTCGNRLHVAAYRARRRAPSPGDEVVQSG
jgi:predicted RNA-binding Zn ribbon-like protein